MILGIGAQVRIFKRRFDECLRVVKVTFDAVHVHIFSRLGLHLPFLHRADAVFRIKHHDFRPRHVLESCQRGFARVAAGRGQDQRRFRASEFFLGGLQ